MNRVVALLGGGLLAAGLAVGAFAHDGKHKEGEGAKVAQTTVVGELIDTACYVSSDGDAKGADHAKCARDCMASGVPAGVLPQNSKDPQAMMFLLTNPKPLAAHAGKTIKVEGQSYANMHAIDVKKLYVQNGSKWQEVQLQDEHHKMTDGEAGHDAGTGHKEGHDHAKTEQGKATTGGQNKGGANAPANPTAGQRQR